MIANVGLLLRPYAAVISARFRMLLQYRMAAFAGFVTQMFWGSVKCMVMAAFYAVATTPPPMTFTAVVAYIWLGQALLALLPWNIDAEIREAFLSGSVVYEMLRPVDLYWLWFARTLAFRVAPTLLRVIPGLVFAMVILPLIGLPEWALRLPPDFLHATAFLASLFATILLSTAITMLMHISIFWTTDGRGVVIFMSGVVTIFAGMIIPLPLFPDWAQSVLQWQPFRGLCDVPFRIYSGDIALDAAAGEILQQFAWTLVLVLLGIWLLDVARRRLVVQGG